MIFFQVFSFFFFFRILTSLSVGSRLLDHTNETSEGKLSFGMWDKTEIRKTGHLLSSKQKDVILKGHIAPPPKPKHVPNDSFRHRGTMLINRK